LELALVLALIMGLAPVLKMKPVFIVIAMAGSAVLLWMGVGMLKSLPTMTLFTDGERKNICSGTAVSTAISWADNDQRSVVSQSMQASVMDIPYSMVCRSPCIFLIARLEVALQHQAANGRVLPSKRWLITSCHTDA
jgi:hypothetical protein